MKENKGFRNPYISDLRLENVGCNFNFAAAPTFSWSKHIYQSALVKILVIRLHKRFVPSQYLDLVSLFFVRTKHT
jgi:hypothetical protein